MATPLNPFLHQRLTQEFGRVVLANEGEALTGRVTTTNGQPSFTPVNSGEYYRVNCPHCSDTRQRLWINHRWGVGIPAAAAGNPTGEAIQLPWMLVCYNNSCYQGQQGYLRRRELERRVYMNMSKKARSDVPIAKGEASEPLGPTELPGRCIRVDQLPPAHVANVYLRDRGFDPADLAHEYGLCYCMEAPDTYFPVIGRLVIPVMMFGQQVGWQGRYIGEGNWKQVQKYYNCRGMHKRQMLYNLDNSRCSPFVVITEGVTDVWRIGPGSVALFGKRMHTQQMGLIRRYWNAAVLLLDEDAEDESLDTFHELRQLMPAARITLPKGQDPGGMTKDAVWAAIEEGCYQQGLDLLQMVQNGDKYQSRKEVCNATA